LPEVYSRPSLLLVIYTPCSKRRFRIHFMEVPH
jgi:hypothetical protein